MITVLLCVLSFMVGCATTAVDALNDERRLQAQIRRLTIELRDARANRQRWQ